MHFHLIQANFKAANLAAFLFARSTSVLPPNPPPPRASPLALKRISRAFPPVGAAAVGGFPFFSDLVTKRLTVLQIVCLMPTAWV